MPKFVIEHAIPGIGGAKAAELQAISQKSCGDLHELGPDVQWVHSHVTGDKIYCVYNAAIEDGATALHEALTVAQSEASPLAAAHYPASLAALAEAAGTFDRLGVLEQSAYVLSL